MSKEETGKKKEEEAPQKAGIPKDWISPNIQMSLSVKYCDMESRTRDYAISLTQYVYSQMYRKEIKHFKDAARYVKESFEVEEKGCWNVVCGIHFGAFFNYETKNCILLYWSSMGFLIWKFG
jgi:hypothetical protein